MEREDDVTLIHKILSGDDTTFGILVEKYQKRIHALCWRKIGDFHHAEEITQDIFLQAYKNLSVLREPNQFAGWLCVIANRRCIDWLRKQNSRREEVSAMCSLEETSLEQIEASSYTHYVSEQCEKESTERRHAFVKKLLKKLPEGERTVVTLYYLGDMTTQEISKFLAVSVNTITSRLQRARKRLQAARAALVQESLVHLQLPANSKENIMRQLEELRSKFNSFMEMENVKFDPALREELLKEVDDEIEDALKGKIPSELVHLVVDKIYPHMGKLGMERRISLLRKYMDDAPEATERFWAHQTLVNSLAHLGSNREAIEEHSRLYRWASQHLSDKYVLKTMSNLNVGGCLQAEARIDDWIQLYDEAAKRLENPDVSQYSRCDFLQIGAEVLRCNGRLDKALLEIEKLERANGEPAWKHYFRFWLAVRTNRLLIYSRQEDSERFAQVLTEASTYMERTLKKQDLGHPINSDDLIWFANDFGCCLVWLKAYNEAKRFLQVATDLGDNAPYCHFQFAVSIWASERHREKTLHHLKIAQDAYVISSYNYQDTYYPLFLGTPEFSDVTDDKEFLAIFGRE